MTNFGDFHQDRYRAGEETEGGKDRHGKTEIKAEKGQDDVIKAMGAGQDKVNKTETNHSDCGEETKGAKKHQDGICDTHQAKTKATGSDFENSRLDYSVFKDIWLTTTSTRTSGSTTPVSRTSGSAAPSTGASGLTTPSTRTSTLTTPASRTSGSAALSSGASGSTTPSTRTSGSTNTEHCRTTGK